MPGANASDYSRVRSQIAGVYPWASPEGWKALTEPQQVGYLQQAPNVINMLAEANANALAKVMLPLLQAMRG